jgi:hypothetical protein
MLAALLAVEPPTPLPSWTTSGASESLCSSSRRSSCVRTLTHEHRSRDAKNTAAMPPPTQPATRSSGHPQPCPFPDDGGRRVRGPPAERPQNGTYHRRDAMGSDVRDGIRCQAKVNAAIMAAYGDGMEWLGAERLTGGSTL